jgi:hypothetical protein
MAKKKNKNRKGNHFMHVRDQGLHDSYSVHHDHSLHDIDPTDTPSSPDNTDETVDKPRGSSSGEEKDFTD